MKQENKPIICPHCKKEVGLNIGFSLYEIEELKLELKA